MGKQPFISHVVNGYSRYDVPESKAFTCTPGILYPVRIDFINARDRVSIEQGIDVRSNPLAVPTFNPYTIRLHRFWVPLQLYHPELRTNGSKFDMNELSLNWIPALPGTVGVGATPTVSSSFTNSLLYWLRASNRSINFTTATASAGTTLPAGTPSIQWVNADTYLAYWDIVRNYYGYSQWGLYSFAWPASWYYTSATTSGSSITYEFNDPGTDSFFVQRYGSLEHLDAYFESQFYPSAVPSSNNTFNRRNLFDQIIRSDIESKGSAAGANGDGFPVVSVSAAYSLMGTFAPTNQFSGRDDSKGLINSIVFNIAHPIAVVPANPDRFSRLLPIGSGAAVSMSGVTTIPQLAIASRLQEYKDLLGAGGSRYSDWLETFFASKIEHVDRPKLLFSASQTVNVQVVMNQAGANNFDGNQYSMPPLGQQGGAIAFNDRLGRRQSYYFREPGYLIDMLSIRPVYYWSGIRPDYLNYEGSDYFNPIYNDIGYQRVPSWRFNQLPSVEVNSSFAQEPCFNEFRSSYDEVLGQISAVNSNSGLPQLYAYWVQQRYLNWPSNWPTSASYAPALFVDMTQVNSPFSSNVEDNFFVNLSYAVQKKNLVNKTFATRLSNR